jgi:mono/diheme cytochrome c family protein
VKRRPFLLSALVVFSAVVSTSAVAEELTFERDVRPILKTHCFQCHGEGGKLEGGLDLRLRRLMATGGDSGAAIEAGKPNESYLLDRLKLGEMPPEDVKHRPTPAEIATIERWIAAGAKTARPEPENIDGVYITEEERSFWAFLPVRRVAPPPVNDKPRVRTPIDRFVVARLEAAGLSLSPEADKQTLLRRAYFDLVGLPPSPAEAEAFLADDAPDAFERLIDRLLESPHYGERWGRHWLDVAGYADSEGYTDVDPVRTDAFRYRDYVIRAFNADKPLDEFLREQLAGDELVGPPYKNLSPEQIDMLIATGFLRMAADGTAQKDVEQNVARNETVAHTMEIVSTSLLGLTVACAQCHDHRYDPIPQQDYYRLRAVFDPALDWQNWRTPPQRRLSLYTDEDRRRAKEFEAEAVAIEAERTKKQAEFVEQVFERELAKLPEEIRETVREARDTPVKERSPEQAKLLKAHPSVNVSAGSLRLYDSKLAAELQKYTDRAKAVRDTKPVEEFVRALTETSGAALPESFVFLRGDHEQRGKPVEPGELTVLSSHEPCEIPLNDGELATTGRRLAYARWLTSGRHPLTARVLVNRVWLNHFGRGIVATPGDFGVLGARPTHPELLDWLADELVRGGWSLKRMHKLIMTSSVYRQTSARRPECEAVDADAALLWRMPVRRIEAETLRDTVLAISGKLNREQFGPPVPVMADEVGQFVLGIENLNAGRPGPVIPLGDEEFRRSIYAQSRRSRPLGVLDTFDLPAMTPNCTVRSSSTVAPQSLLLMNSPFIAARAGDFAARVIREAGDEPEAQIELAWRLAYARAPSERELDSAREFLQRQRAHFASPDATQEGLAVLCQALLSSNELLYVD